MSKRKMCNAMCKNPKTESRQKNCCKMRTVSDSSSFADLCSLVRMND
jgi:hypothetical protein